MPTPTDWRHYVRLCDLYYHNAEEAIRKDEFSKATELLWGAVATAAKAVAAHGGKQLTAHRHGDDSLETFVQALAAARGDELLWNDFLDAHAMHRNFYEDDMSSNYGRKYFMLSRRLIGSLYQDLPLPVDTDPVSP